MKILFFGQITRLWGLRGKPTPSTIVRCSQLASELDRLGFSCTVLFRRTRDFSRLLQEIRKSDVVVFHRLQFPLTNVPEAPIEPFLHLASRATNKTTIFDIDDAIFLQDPVLTEFFSAKSDIVTVGSHQLAAYARKWNRKVALIPTPVPTEIFSPKVRSRRRGDFVLGWHGTAYTQLHSLRILVPVLTQLAERYDIRLKLIGSMGNRKVQSIFNGIPGLQAEFGRDEWIPYERMPASLADVDIGLSPLTDSLWSRSKCALKDLEYMSMAIPVVASAVGEHNFIIRNGINGYLATSTADWLDKISRLIEDGRFRDGMGGRGRQTVNREYSVRVVAQKFANVIARRKDAS
jgi:glycosyltransferase involved in cell wall biosynthesis